MGAVAASLSVLSLLNFCTVLFYKTLLGSWALISHFSLFFFCFVFVESKNH